MGSRFRDMSQFSKFPYLGMKSGIWRKVPKLLSFYPGGSKLSLFSLYGQPFSRYWLVFEISIFGHEIWNLKTGPKSCTYTLFLPQGSKLSFCSTDSLFWDTGQFAKFPYLFMKSGIWRKVPKLLSFYPGGSKLSLFSLYGQPFSRHWLVFKIPIFGHESWNLKTGPKSCMYTLVLPQGSKLSFCSTDSRFRDTGQFAKFQY